MTRAKAIRDYCYEYSGDSPKEVIICHLFDCPLWVYRTGNHVNNKAYKVRMGKALKNYARDIKALEEMGIHVDFRAK